MNAPFARVGGTYAVEMKNEEVTHKPHGEYLEILPPEKLVFTWISEGFTTNSTVTIELVEAEGQTELTLTHELPADGIEDHRVGWTNALSHLVEFLAQRH